MGKENGNVLVFGLNYSGQLGLGHNKNVNIPTLLMTDKTIKNIICNGQYTKIYKNSGDVLVFGYNYHGQLGLGHDNNVNIPTLLMTDKTILT